MTCQVDEDLYDKIPDNGGTGMYAVPMPSSLACSKLLAPEETEKRLTNIPRGRMRFSFSLLPVRGLWHMQHAELAAAGAYGRSADLQNERSATRSEEVAFMVFWAKAMSTLCTSLGGQPFVFPISRQSRVANSQGSEGVEA